MADAIVAEDEEQLPAELASSSDGGADAEDQRAQERWSRLRGLTGPQSSSSESDDEQPDQAAPYSDSEVEVCAWLLDCASACRALVWRSLYA